MRRGLLPAGIVGLAALLVAGLLEAVHGHRLPLGVPGEWTWGRVAFAPSALGLGLAGVAVALYAVLAALVGRWLAARATIGRETVAVAVLAVAAVAVQPAAQTGAPDGYGLAKWVFALHTKGSSGYFTLAEQAEADPWAFLAAYPSWIRGQDSLHIGTHPPGLVAVELALLRSMRGAPAAARFIVDHAPDSVVMAFRVYSRDSPLSVVEQATLIVTGLLTLVACALTVVPLYLLARRSVGPEGAWAAAALWPLVPSAVLFQPTADTAYPLLATSALALAAWSGRLSARSGAAVSVACGVVLGLGMQFTLAFLAVGLVVALVLLGDGRRWRGRLARVAATGAGFLGLTAAVWVVTRANPFVIWWWNQQNHARFYTEFPRTYRAWLVANPIELAVGLGVPITVWALAGLARPRAVPRVALFTALVLVVLTVGGRNLSEVGRLWLPFMPALVTLAGSALARAGGGPWSLAATLALLGGQVLALQAMIQVVYPF